MEAVDIEIDNLFNDGHLDGQLDQILPTEDALQSGNLAVPGLAEQFLKLRFCGAYQRTAWSRQGHVAIISEDASTVSVGCLRSSIKKKIWQLSKGEPLDTIFENAVNATWSPSGFDLVITDSRGRIAVYSMTTTSLNRLTESKSALTDTPEELGILIGIWWFSQDRQDRARHIISSATRGESKWSHNGTKAKAFGPMYPRAFCIVDRRGVLSLLYQRPGTRYLRVSVDLPMVPGSICSHAAFSPTSDGKLLIAVYSTGGNLSVYHVQFTWPQDLWTDSTGNSQPSMNVEVIDSCVSMWNDNDGTVTGLTTGYKPDEWALTHLTIVPTSDVESASREPPSIWAVYTLTNSAVSASHDGYLLNSVIRRWSVSSAVRSLNPRFDDIPTKSETSTGDEAISIVERQADLSFSHAVSSIELVDSGQMVAISTSDGRTELWNPTTQALVSYEGQSDEVTSLAQFGFMFNPLINSINVAMSPNACSSLSLAEDAKPSLQHVQYPIQAGTQDLDLTDPQQSASIAAIILAFARSCWSNTNGDDVLACAVANYTANQYATVLSEFYSTLFRDTEFIHEKAPGSELERLAMKPLIVKVLSFQMGLLNNKAISLNASDEGNRYAILASAWAWLAINLRYITVTLYIFQREFQMSMAGPQPNQPPPQPLSPSFIDAICNTIHWVLDLFRFIVISILDIGDRQTNPDFFTSSTFANNLGDAAGDGSQGLVALLLNCQWTRSFLITISRALRSFIEMNEKTRHPIMERVFFTIRKYSFERGMNTTAIDKLLDPRWYVRNGLREGEQMDAATIAKRQITMYTTGRVGPEYANTLRMLLDKAINEPEKGLRATKDIQRLKMWFDTPDLNWLLLGFDSQFTTDTKSTCHGVLEEHGRSHVPKKYDMHRKSLIQVTSPGQLVRRCVRCGSLSGDVDGIDKSWGKNMVGYLAKCVCDAFFIVEPFQDGAGDE